MQNRPFLTSANLGLFVSLFVLSAAEVAAQGGAIVVTRPITVDDQQLLRRTASPTAAKIGDSKNVTISLPEEAPRINPTTIKLKAESVTFQKEDKISELLKGSGIEPDVNALSLVYDLNPTIDNLNAVPSNTPVLLPRVEGDIYTQMAITKGYRVSVARDFSSLHRVNSKEVELRQVSAMLVTVDPNQFSDPKAKAIIMKALERAQTALRVIGSNRFAVSEKVLRQSVIEADSMKATVQESISHGGQMKGSLDVIERNAAALEERSSNLSSGGSAQIRVEVQTLKKKDGSPVGQLRVFYAPELDLSDVDKYRNPSTPTTEAIPIGGRFTFWAGEGDNSSHRVSDMVTITVHSKDNDPVKLQVK